MKKIEILKLADILGRMKNVKRIGWMRHTVACPESDADHSFSLAMLIMLFAPKKLDKLKCLQLALVHDLPEIICGDMVPGEMDVQKKSDLELDAMRTVAQEAGKPELLELFKEYEQRNTPEAKFVWVMDRIDNVFTARFYEDTLKIGLVKEFGMSVFERLSYLEDTELRCELDKILNTLMEK